MKFEHGLIAAMAVLIGSILAFIAVDEAETPQSQIEISEPQIVEEPPVTVSTPKVETVPKAMTPLTVTVSLPSGSAVPGCEETNECYIPTEVSISVGDTVTWSNDDTAAHTVTSGIASEGPDGIFDSSLFIAGNTFEHTFDEAGEYDYFCMVHPWMTGKVQVS